MEFGIMPGIRVVVADYHHVVRTGLVIFLTNQIDISVIEEVADETMLSHTIVHLQPDVLLLESGIHCERVLEVLDVIQKERLNVKILILSTAINNDEVLFMLRVGVSGYVLKEDSPDMFLEAIRTVNRGRRWLSPQITNVFLETMITEQTTAIELTTREIEVLQLMTRGYRNEQIADELHLTHQTVKNYVRNIFNKLGVRTRVEAVLYAIKKGLASTQGS